MYLLCMSTGSLFSFQLHYIIRVAQLSFVVLYEEVKQEPEQDKT